MYQKSVQPSDYSVLPTGRLSSVAQLNVEKIRDPVVVKRWQDAVRKIITGVRLRLVGKRTRGMFIHPESLFMLVWEVLYVMNCLMQIALIVFAGCFSGENVIMFALIICSDAFFLCDIGVSTVKGFFTDSEERHLNVNASAMFFNYVHDSGQYGLDILTIMPIDYVALAAGWVEWDSRDLALFRLQKLLRLVRVHWLTNSGTSLLWRTLEYSHSIPPSILRLFMQLVWTLLVSHFMAGGFNLVFDYCRNEIAEEGYSKELSEYSCAMYWSLSTVSSIGYASENLVADSMSERWFSGLSMLVGAIVFSIIIGSVSNVVAAADADAIFFRQKMDRVTRILQRRVVPHELEKRIQHYYYYLFRHGRGSDEVSILNDLSSSLLTEYKIHIMQSMLAALPFFRDLHPSVLKRLVNSMHLVHFAPGDFIVSEGELAEEMFFIARGRAEVIARSKRLSVLSEGSFVGESCMLGMQVVQPASVRSLTYCDVYVLRADGFDKLLAADREHGAGVEKEIIEAAKRTVHTSVDSMVIRRAFVLSVAFFKPLEEHGELIDVLAKHFHPATYIAGDIVVQQGVESEGAIFVHSGNLHVSRSMSTSQLESGACYGELHLLFKGVCNETIMASELSIVYHLRRENVLEAVRSYPNLTLPLLHAMSRTSPSSETPSPSVSGTLTHADDLKVRPSTIDEMAPSEKGSLDTASPQSEPQLRESVSLPARVGSDGTDALEERDSLRLPGDSLRLPGDTRP